MGAMGFGEFHGEIFVNGVSKAILGGHGWINWEYTTTIPNYNTTIIGVVYINIYKYHYP
jgi:hypothetical protein